jgi:hypothetical protein
VDIMHEFEDAEVRYLTQSFRFGQAVAEEANLWLSYLEAPLRLRGMPTISSRLEALEQPDAILCRTNADVIAQAMAAQERGKKVAVVGGTQDISSFAAAVDDLRLRQDAPPGAVGVQDVVRRAVVRARGGSPAAASPPRCG